MEEKTVHIPNITCRHCVATIRLELEDLPGVDTVTGDPETKNVTFRFGPPATWEEISGLLSELGFPAE